MGTILLGSFHGGLITFEADYRDNNMRLQNGRCIHGGDLPARVELYEDGAADPTFAYTLNPGTTTFNIMNQQVIVNPDGTISMPYGYVLSYPWSE